MSILKCPLTLQIIKMLFQKSNHQVHGSFDEESVLIQVPNAMEDGSSNLHQR